MTLNLLLKVSVVLQKFYQFSLNAKLSYSLYKILKKIQEELDFYSKEEEKLVETYAEGIDEKGKVIFSDEQKKKMFLNEIEKLQNTNVDLQFDKINVSLNDIQNVQLAPSDFYLLENIINFVDGNEEKNKEEE